MNIHHLELFYYVARHRGIAEAVRKMPYGIQQPAISSQIIQLEESLGTTLFRRRPFELTEAGRELFCFIEPFFSNVEAAAERVRRGGSLRLRIGASETVLRDHLPGVLLHLRKRFPAMKVSLREGDQVQLESLVREAEIDLAVTSMADRLPAGLKSKLLVELPLVLLIPQSCKWPTPASLWALDRIEETLICLPASDAICRVFQKELARQRIDWFPGIEVSSLQLVHAYVKHGFGIGLSVDEPGLKLPSGVRALRLEDFPRLAYGIIWQGRLSPIAQALAELMVTRAKSLLV